MLTMWRHAGGPAALSCALVAAALVFHGALAKQRLIWSDEFRTGCKEGDDMCVNNGIDLKKWAFDLGDGSDYGPNLIGWGNWQRQCHTNSSANARVEAFPQNPFDGYLVIQGRYEPDRDCYNVKTPASKTNYTSARLHTRGKAAFKWKGDAGNSTPVRIDLRVQVPLVDGTWPAGWMLPDTPDGEPLASGPYGDGWCTGGEIDIFEHTNTNRYLISNVHYGGQKNASWLDCKEKVGKFRAGDKAGVWNVLSLVWDSTVIRFLANGVQYNELKQGQWFTGAAPEQPYAPFDVPFYLILDQAIGGLYPGFNINNTAIESGAASYRVDYVRVYDLLP